MDTSEATKRNKFTSWEGLDKGERALIDSLTVYLLKLEEDISVMKQRGISTRNFKKERDEKCQELVDTVRKWGMRPPPTTAPARHDEESVASIIKNNKEARFLIRELYSLAEEGINDRVRGCSDEYIEQLKYVTYKLCSLDFTVHTTGKIIPVKQKDDGNQESEPDQGDPMEGVLTQLY